MEDSWTRGEVAWVVGLAVALILLPFKFFENSSRKKLIARIEDPTWLAEEPESSSVQETVSVPASAHKQAEEASLQECYDHASRLVNLLKGVLADPTDVKLARLNELITNSINLNDQTWHDASIRLAETFQKYDKEYEALVLTIAHHSNHPTKLHVAHKLVTSFPELAGTVEQVAAAVLSSPSMRGATTLTPR